MVDQSFVLWAMGVLAICVGGAVLAGFLHNRRLQNTLFGVGLAWLGLCLMIAVGMRTLPDGARFAGSRELRAPPAESEETARALDNVLQPSSEPPRRDGTGLALVLDVSDSMAGLVPDASNDRLPAPKIDVARRCVLAIVCRAEEYVAKHPEPQLHVGLFEFSAVAGRSSCRSILRIAAPRALDAESALKRMRPPEGQTPIGEAIVEAKRALDAAGFRRSHILVITDGINTRGWDPADVTAALARLPEDRRPGLYCIAFDIDPANFDGIKKAGGVVLSAADERGLQEALDYVLTGRIMVERGPAEAEPR